MIVATAGHVDHGKTLLVKALTGVDTDRLPEEKKRGLTIDLGFAYLPIGAGQTIGFIDVPGHERFIHNMLCGVAEIDFVLFIVAADDGPMPQTREHLAILDLLGVRDGAVALTKVDRVAPDRVAEVESGIAALLAGTTLADAPIFPVSAITGAGVEELKDRLVRAARKCRPRAANGNFRLAIDRCFSVVGAGLVVTGTAVSGSLAVGDQVKVLLAELPARVRTIHAQNAPSKTGRAGQRCALNLVGADIKNDLIRRGDWIVTGDVPEPARKIDARLRILESEQQALAHWTPVHVHLGAADVTGRVAVLEGSGISPGQSGLVQLVLDRPIGALHGDGLIIRDQSARRTIGGGRVIDIFPPVRGRAKPERLAYIRAMEGEDEEVALASLLEEAANGLDLSKFAANRNLTSDEAARLFERVPMKSIATEADLFGFSPAHWDGLKATILPALAAWHRRAPDTVGPAEDRILYGTSIRLPREAAVAITAELAREGVIIKEGMGVRLPTHRPKLNPADVGSWRKVAPLLDESALHPPTVREIAEATGDDPRKVESLLVRVSRLGLVVRLAQNRFFRPSALRRLGEIAEDLAEESGNGLVTAAAFRDRSAIGRNLTIEVLEFFDRVGLTRRVGDAHEVLRPAADVFGDTRVSSDIDSTPPAEKNRIPVGRTDFKSGERR